MSGVIHVWEKKRASIKAPQNQPFSFYLEMIEQECLSHGKAAGIKRAEAFLCLPLFWPS